MSVLIRMEIPSNCAECPLNHDAECAVKNCMVIDDCYVRRASWCPLVPIPPHGRLIDEGEVRRLIAEMIPVAKDIINSRAILEWVAEYLPQCHAIIEAEEDEDD